MNTTNQIEVKPMTLNVGGKFMSKTTHYVKPSTAIRNNIVLLCSGRTMDGFMRADTDAVTCKACLKLQAIRV